MARLGQPLLFVFGAPTCDLFILTVVRLERPLGFWPRSDRLTLSNAFLDFL